MHQVEPFVDPIERQNVECSKCTAFDQSARHNAILCVPMLGDGWQPVDARASSPSLSGQRNLPDKQSLRRRGGPLIGQSLDSRKMPRARLAVGNDPTACRCTVTKRVSSLLGTEAYRCLLPPVCEAPNLSELMPKPGRFRFELACIVLIPTRQQWHTLRNGHAEALERLYLVRIVGRRAYRADTRSAQHRSADSIVAQVGREAQPVICLHRVGVLQPVGANLIEEAYATAFLAKVKQCSTPAFPDGPHLRLPTVCRNRSAD